MEDLYLYTVIFIIASIATKHFLYKIRNLPPSPFPAIPLLRHLYLLREPIHRSLLQISARLGPILFLRLGCRKVLLVSSPAGAEECLHANDVVFSNRPRFISGDIFGYNSTALSWAPYGDHWRRLRRISNTEILSAHRLQMLASIRSEEVRLFLRRIYPGEGSDYRTVELKSSLLEMTANVMTRMLAGRRYYGEGEESSEEGKRFMCMMKEISGPGGLTSIGDFFPVLRRLGIKGSEKRIEALFHKFDGFIQDIVDYYRNKSVVSEADSKNRTMIEVLLSLQKSDPGFYTEEIIKGLILVMLLGGTETTSGTLEWALSLLLNNPEAMKKAKAEIDGHVGRNRLIEESDLNGLPYLHCIILETMRIRPIAPLLVRESSEECSVGGYRVPGGTILMVNMWALSHDSNLWDEPEEFKPERFEGIQGNRVGFKFMPFGSGRRVCPGDGLSVRMVGLVLASIIQCFEWKRLGEELVDLRENIGLTSPKIKPLVAKCCPRKDIFHLIS